MKWPIGKLMRLVNNGLLANEGLEENHQGSMWDWREKRNWQPINNHHRQQKKMVDLSDIGLSKQWIVCQWRIRKQTIRGECLLSGWRLRDPGSNENWYTAKIRSGNWSSFPARPVFSFYYSIGSKNKSYEDYKSPHLELELTTSTKETHVSQLASASLYFFWH